MFIKQNFAQFWFLCRDQTYCAFGLRLCLGILAFFFFFYARVSRDTMYCSVGLVHCLRDLQVLYLEKKIKMNLTALFTHLKIILLQCFQFSAI